MIVPRIGFLSRNKIVFKAKKERYANEEKRICPCPVFLSKECREKIIPVEDLSPLIVKSVLAKTRLKRSPWQFHEQEQTKTHGKSRHRRDVRRFFRCPCSPLRQLVPIGNGARACTGLWHFGIHASDDMRSMDEQQDVCLAQG
jgi:hypothetical protein